MKRISLFLGVFFLTLVFCGQHALAQEQEDDLTISGEVVDVGADNITVDVGGLNVTVQVDPTAENDMDGDDALEEAIGEADDRESGTSIEIGEVVELETGLGRRGLTLKRIRRPFRRDILCNGSVTYTNSTVTCAGITAKLLDEDDGDPLSTEIIGQYGVKTSLDALDLNAVRVRIGHDEEYGFFAKRIVQGPVIGVRGFIEDIDAEEKTFTMNGLNIRYDENTAIHPFRSALVPRPMDYSLLQVKMPVRVMAQFVDGEYYALGILILNTNRVRMRAVIEDIRDDGMAVIKTPGGLTITIRMDGEDSMSPGDFIDFTGEIQSGGMIQATTVGRVGEKVSRPLFKRVKSSAFNRQQGPTRPGQGFNGQQQGQSRPGQGQGQRPRPQNMPR